jgi:hypothetical protein
VSEDGFRAIADADELWDGEMESYELDGKYIGLGINPRTACLKRYEVRVAGGRVLVGRTAVPAGKVA